MAADLPKKEPSFSDEPSEQWALAHALEYNLTDQTRWSRKDSTRRLKLLLGKGGLSGDQHLEDGDRDKWSRPILELCKRLEALRDDSALRDALQGLGTTDRGGPASSPVVVLLPMAYLELKECLSLLEGSVHCPLSALEFARRVWRGAGAPSDRFTLLDRLEQAVVACFPSSQPPCRRHLRRVTEAVVEWVSRALCSGLDAMKDWTAPSHPPNCRHGGFSAEVLAHLLWFRHAPFEFALLSRFVCALDGHRPTLSGVRMDLEEEDSVPNLLAEFSPQQTPALRLSDLSTWAPLTQFCEQQVLVSIASLLELKPAPDSADSKDAPLSGKTGPKPPSTCQSAFAVRRRIIRAKRDADGGDSPAHQGKRRQFLV